MNSWIWGERKFFKNWGQCLNYCEKNFKYLIHIKYMCFISEVLCIYTINFFLIKKLRWVCLERNYSVSNIWILLLLYLCRICLKTKKLFNRQFPPKYLKSRVSELNLIHAKIGVPHDNTDSRSQQTTEAHPFSITPQPARPKWSK